MISMILYNVILLITIYSQRGFVIDFTNENDKVIDELVDIC